MLHNTIAKGGGRSQNILLPGVYSFYPRKESQSSEQTQGVFRVCLYHHFGKQVAL